MRTGARNHFVGVDRLGLISGKATTAIFKVSSGTVGVD
jgi:hypothetical protein